MEVDTYDVIAHVQPIDRIAQQMYAFYVTGQLCDVKVVAIEDNRR